MNASRPALDHTKGGNYSVQPSGGRSLVTPPELAGLRLDQALARLFPEHSRSRLQGWIRAGRLRVDGRVEDDPKRRIDGGERLRLDEEAQPEAAADQPQDIPLALVYEDDALLVIDKPAGLVVHPGSGNWSGTLLNALLHHVPALAALPRAGIVHRLDKDTSGLLVVAKTLQAQTALVRQLQARSMSRTYLALVCGDVAGGGVVDAPLGRHPTQRTKMAVVAGGREARTHYRVRRRYGRCTLVECSLETGRTHQIRVHMASLGHPLVGDPVYAGRRRCGVDFPRQALHACRLGLQHPDSGRPLSFESPLPGDLRGLLDALDAADAAPMGGDVRR